MQLRITKLIFVETGTYNDLALRPYQTSVDPASIAALQEATMGGRNYHREALAGIAGSILRPTSEARGIVSIENGWDTPRLRFLMAIEQNDFANSSTIKYISGYTDYVGVSHAGTLDPNMRLFINNVVDTKAVMYATPRGNEMHISVSDANQILSGGFSPSLIWNQDNTTRTMRPADIFTEIGGQMVTASDPNDSIYDTRTSFAAAPLKASKRENGLATGYLNRVIHAHKTAMSEVDENMNIEDISAKATANSRDKVLNFDPVFSLLQRQTTLATGSSVTYGELCHLSPGLDDRAIVALQRNVYQTQNHSRGSTEYWHGANNETIFATILTHSVPAIMMDLMLTKMAFMATNQTLDGQFAITFGEIQSFAEGIDIMPHVQRFEQRLRREILQDLTRNNLIDIQLTASFDVLGETAIELSIAGGPLIRYVAPSFCDGLFAPLLANDKRTVDLMAHDISALVDNLEVDHSIGRAGYSPIIYPPTLTHGGAYGNSETV